MSRACQILKVASVHVYMLEFSTECFHVLHPFQIGIQLFEFQITPVHVLLSAQAVHGCRQA